MKIELIQNQELTETQESRKARYEIKDCIITLSILGVLALIYKETKDRKTKPHATKALLFMYGCMHM